MVVSLARSTSFLTVTDQKPIEPLPSSTQKLSPTDEELDELAWNWYSKTGSTWYQIAAFRAFARAVLARWGAQ